MHSLHCKRNPQQAKIRFVAESAALLLFFDLRCCFGFLNYLNHCTAQNCSKNRRVCGIRLHLRIPHTNFADSLTFADSTYILRIPLTFCGIHLQLRNPEELAIFACCGIRN